MKCPYENLFLGAFIFRLGYKMGEVRKLKNTPFAANLFQQTPLDAAFGDFMCASKTRGFLLEFKKSWQDRGSERGKDKFQILQGEPTLLAQAAKCHLIGYGKDEAGERAPGNIDLVFGTYFEVLSAKSEKEIRISWTMDSFLQEIIDEKIGANSKEFCDYISKFLELLERRRKQSSSRKRLFANAEIGALASAKGGVAILNTENGFYAMPLSSIIDLGVNLRIPIAEELTRSIRPPSPDRYSRTIDIEHSRGPLDEHSRNLETAIDIEKRSPWLDKYVRNFEVEKNSRGIDIDREM